VTNNEVINEDADHVKIPPDNMHQDAIQDDALEENDSRDGEREVSRPSTRIQSEIRIHETAEENTHDGDGDDDYETPQQNLDQTCDENKVTEEEEDNDYETPQQDLDQTCDENEEEEAEDLDTCREEFHEGMAQVNVDDIDENGTDEMDVIRAVAKKIAEDALNKAILGLTG